MNVLNVMTIKRSSEYLNAEETVEAAAKRVHVFGALPVVSACGEYLGIVDERILRWALSTGEVDADSLLVELSEDFDLIKTGAAAECSEVAKLAGEYGILPVTDDRGMYIGTVFASDIPQSEWTEG